MQYEEAHHHIYGVFVNKPDNKIFPNNIVNNLGRYGKNKISL
jgi:hypothetical protein